MTNTHDKTDPVGYSELYDAHYYLDTLEWTEEKCSDPTCEFCVNRPSKYEGE